MVLLSLEVGVGLTSKARESSVARRKDKTSEGYGIDAWVSRILVDYNDLEAWIALDAHMSFIFARRAREQPINERDFEVVGRICRKVKTRIRELSDAR